MPMLLHQEETLDTLSSVELKRHLQKVKLIRHLYIRKEESTFDISNELAISMPTATSLIGALADDGLVEKRGRGKSLGGRKPDLYGLQNNSFFVLAVHIERAQTRVGLYDNNNRCISGIQAFSVPLSKDRTALRQIIQAMQKTIRSAGIPDEKLIGIGLSMPGLVSAEEGRNFTFLIGEDTGTIREVLEKKFRKPVFIHNDVKSTCFAELRFGKAREQKHALLLSMDWGIGLGIIMDGKLQTGASGFAGEFGHIPLVEEGIFCACGKRGCLETVASGVALSRMIKEGIAYGEHSLIDLKRKDGEIDPQIVIDAANRGDQFAINSLSSVGASLGKGIAILMQLFNPSLIILGGKMAEARQFITVPIQQSINIFCSAPLRERTAIVLSELGPDASLLGSVASVVENVLEHQIELAKQN